MNLSQIETTSSRESYREMVWFFIISDDSKRMDSSVSTPKKERCLKAAAMGGI